MLKTEESRKLRQQAKDAAISRLMNDYPMRYEAYFKLEMSKRGFVETKPGTWKLLKKKYEGEE